MGSLCQVSKIMYTISYAFNIALLIVIIVITTTERLFECIRLLSRMFQNLGLCILLEGFTNFSVDPYYDPLSLVMINIACTWVSNADKCGISYFITCDTMRLVTCYPRKPFIKNCSVLCLASCSVGYSVYVVLFICDQIL